MKGKRERVKGKRKNLKPPCKSPWSPCFLFPFSFNLLPFSNYANFFE